jgi:diadenosine tetraphosphate (Ap4A) HIT family hydrolase
VHPTDEYLVSEDVYFRAEHSGDCCVPGYLIMSARDPVSSISGLSAGALQNLGPRLALMVRAIETVVRPELVYCARFGEEVSALHFHLFPRTASMARQFLAEVGKGARLNGPLLLNWARERHASATAPIREYVKAG